MRYLITGCAGFIGSQLADRLLQNCHEVVGFDNFSTGREEFIKNAVKGPRFQLLHGDLLDSDRLVAAMKGCEFVFHLAANADVRFGARHPRRDLEQNTIATSNVLEAMRIQGIRKIAFPSTGSVYGEPSLFPTPEHASFPLQTSFYGASKLAAEGLIQAYCEAFGFQAWIFRFVSILGERYTHGHIIDFYRSLHSCPKELKVLGDGKQKKSYLYVQDCIDAMLCAVERAGDKVNIFNLGTDEHCTVDDSVGWICAELGLSPRLIYSGGPRGWVGDSPFIYLHCGKLRALGWRPKLSIREAVVRTVRYLRATPWALEKQ